jgi:hypothetical protein
MKLDPALITSVRSKKRGTKSSHNGAHAYKRLVTPNGKEQYLCTLPGCTHSLNMSYWIIGKENRCDSCGMSFIIGENRILTCEDCLERNQNAQ